MRINSAGWAACLITTSWFVPHHSWRKLPITRAAITLAAFFAIVTLGCSQPPATSTSVPSPAGAPAAVPTTAQTPATTIETVAPTPAAPVTATLTAIPIPSPIPTQAATPPMTPVPPAPEDTPTPQAVQPTPFPAAAAAPTITLNPALGPTPGHQAVLRTLLVWTEDQLTDDEDRALQALTRLTLGDPDLGLAVADYHWVADAISSDEKWALEYLTALHSRDPALGARFAELSWVADGITEFDQRALQYLNGIHRKNPLASAEFVALPWLSDGIASEERWALQYLFDFLDQDLAFGAQMLQRPWVVDGITEHEQWSLFYLSEIHEANAVVGEAIANLPWALDSIAADDRWALRRLNDLRQADPDLAAQLASMPFFTESITGLDLDALDAIDNLRSNHPDILQRLLTQDWYLDGLDQMEAALVMMVGARESSILGPDDLKGFLTRHHAESRTVELPLTGEVELIFVQSSQNSLNDEIVDQVEDAIRVIEGFMATPFPASEAVLLMATPGELSDAFDVAGLNFGTHMVIDPSLARQGDNNRVLNHEVAHYYWGPHEAPLWFYEGSSDFLSSYIRDRLYGDSFADEARRVESQELRYCNGMGMTTVQKLIDDLENLGYAQHSVAPYYFCNYSTGHNLLLSLFSALGSDGMRAAMANIYQISITEGRPATETEIYRAFLDETTPVTIDGFNAVYLDLHGGSLPES